jgi:S1-C subfamily serine protease
MLASLALVAALLPTTQELRSTVTLTGNCIRSCHPGEMTLGAGEIVSRRPDGTLVVLTARHVIESIATPRVYIRNDAEPGVEFASFAQGAGPRRATVIAYASNVDLALVAFRPLEDDDYAFAALAADDRPASAKTGVVIGDPNGFLWTVSRYTFLQNASSTFLLDCWTCGPGDSGGGVFNAAGRLVGILVQQRVEFDDGAAPQRTTQFLAVSLAELRLFLGATERQRSQGPAAVSAAWLRFDEMRSAR